MDEKFVDQLIRVRQSTLRELVKVYAAAAGLQDDTASKLPGQKTKEEKAQAALGLDSTSFKSASGKADAIALGGIPAELKLMGILKHGTAKPVVGGDKSTDYSSTLARNACHFPPESWHALGRLPREGPRRLRPAGIRLAARVWILKKAKRGGASAMSSPVTDLTAADAREEERIAQKANEAMLHNGFGDHYLQDSYAAGHLINKTMIMQWYVQYLDNTPSAWDAHREQELADDAANGLHPARPRRRGPVGQEQGGHDTHGPRAAGGVGAATRKPSRTSRAIGR